MTKTRTTLALGALLATAACGRPDAATLAAAGVGNDALAPAPQDDRDREEPFAHRNDETALWRDRRTGCWYVVFAGYRAGGITPRLQPDGRPLCDRPAGRGYDGIDPEEDAAATH